jgi:hypothetical protein
MELPPDDVDRIERDGSRSAFVTTEALDATQLRAIELADGWHDNQRL